MRVVKGGLLATTAVAAVTAIGVGCAFDDGPDLDAAKRFERFPIYWVGERFEGLELEDISGTDGGGIAVVLIYGSCTPDGGFEPSCAPPLQIQIFPLCYHLEAVAQADPPPTTRGAPVGTQDTAPVLLTRRTQIKVYRGEGTDAGIAQRALGALRSLNSVGPVVRVRDPIPPAPPAVLSQPSRCRG